MKDAVKSKIKNRIKNKNKNIQLDDSSVGANSIFLPFSAVNQVKGTERPKTCKDLRCLNGGFCVTETSNVLTKEVDVVRTWRGGGVWTGGGGGGDARKEAEVIGESTVRCQCPLGMRGRLCEKGMQVKRNYSILLV